MKRVLTLVLCAVLAPVLSASLGAAEGGSSGKPRIAVLEFTNKANNDWWWHNGAAAAQDVFVTELVKSRKFVVIERERINAIMQEKGLTLSKDVDAKTAMQIGKLLGVNYMLTGALTEYGNTDTNAHGPGVGNLPSFGVHKRVFVAALNARVFNVSTGEIVWADEARKEESSSSVSVGGFGGGVHDDRMFDKVLKPIIQELVASLKSSDL
ncbi:MAG TPA: CsgG/HfaB family protein [Thermoanaerobaculia bacterium]|jgi:curli biogenesis system outer membrane secretion channel CsgG|nr:CsgG/HfaB family protein [Thermoanaerobaculia bacterium]HXO27308.1 CsgG/HfaB family protein [Thermoanaerobaculia bacterium]